MSALAGLVGALAMGVVLVTMPLGLRAQLPAPTPAPQSQPQSQSQSAHQGSIPLGQRIAAAGSLTGGPTQWSELSARQHTALAPLQRIWTEIAPDHQQKWIEIATRLPSLPPQEQSRIQTRMTEWAQMSAQERGRARLRFQEAKRLPAPDRQARWEEFQALTPEQRHELSERAALAAARSNAASGSTGAAARAAAERRSAASGPASAQAAASGKAGVAARESVRAASEVAIAPAIVQAKPGVTTTLMSRRATAAQHQRNATPRIAAASDRIDRTTLLPRRPAARAEPAAGSGPARQTDGVNDAAAGGALPSAPQPAVAPVPRPSMEMPNPEFYK